ncbi:DNA repair protein RecO [Sphingomonas sp. ID0503]|uniref:DNA repair protein RecO n=1 Tax=Sphingomonas sp. ID0503 TaxID=3399691 RepID=UPI003AFA5BA3
MHVTADAVVCAVLAHGEHGAVVRAMTPMDGLLAGYVPGGRSRRMRPVLQPGNLVRAEFRARTEAQLAVLSVELIHSRAPLLGEPLAAAAIDWVTALTAAALPEGQPYPEVHSGLDGMLAAIEAAPSARAWAAALVRYELLLLSALGFGLDLSGCAAGGAGELAYVSPKSAAAVSREMGQAYAARLLPLPAFLLDGSQADWTGIEAGLRLAGHFLGRDILTDRRADVLAARERLVERLRRITG